MPRYGFITVIHDITILLTQITETCEIQRRVIIKVPHPSAIINDGLQLNLKHRARLADKLDAALAWINAEFNLPEKFEDTYFRKYIKIPSLIVNERLIKARQDSKLDGNNVLNSPTQFEEIVCAVALSSRLISNLRMNPRNWRTDLEN